MTFRDRPSLTFRFLPVWVLLAALLVMLAGAVALSGWAGATEPGPDDGLPLEEYERRIAGWCDGLVANYGWVSDPDGSVSGWPGRCWRPDDRQHSHAECQAMGYEWDCPLPDPYPDDTPDSPYVEADPEPEPEPEVELVDPPVSLDDTTESVDPCVCDCPG